MVLKRKLHALKQKCERGAASWRRPARPMRVLAPQLRRWYSRSALGHYTLLEENAFLEELLCEHRGARVLYLSSIADRLPGLSSPFRSLYRVCGAGEVKQAQVSTRCEFDALPFESESLDIVVLHHVLEFAEVPQQVLKEAARVTASGGHVVVISFNPLSASGLWATLWGGMHRNSVWCRRNLFLYRIRDWLAFLDCNDLGTRYLCHSLPLNHRGYLRLNQPIGAAMSKLNLPLSSVFAQVSRKETQGMNLLKPDWKAMVLQRALSVPKAVQPLRARSVASESHSRYKIH